MSTLFGTSIYGGDIAPTFTALRPQMIRVYDDQSKMAAVAKRGIPVAMSFRTWDDQAVASALKALPAGSTLSIKHEPEDDVAAGALTLATWRSWQLKLVDAFRKSGRLGQVFPATILMGWTLDSHSGRKWQDYLTPEVVAALKTVPGAIAGWDTYVGPNQGGPDGPTVTATAVYADTIAVSRQVGLRWGIFETGCRVDATAAPKQAKWWPTAFELARQTDGHCFLLWNSPANHPGDTFTFQIDAYPQLVAVWRDAMTTPAPVTYTQAQLDSAVATAVTAAVASQKATDDAATAAALATADASAKAALAVAVANAKSTAETEKVAAVAAAVAAQKATDDAALFAVQQNANAALLAEQAHGLVMLNQAKTDAAAHLKDVQGKVDYALRKSQTDVKNALDAVRAGVKTLLT